MPESTITITRTFNAPVEKVFDAFSHSEAIAGWWGAEDNPVAVSELDFRPGGIFHYSMDMMGHRVWGRFQYARIQRPRLLEFVFTFANANTEVVRMPFSEHWPMEVYNRLEFTEKNSQTTIRMTAWPLNATDEEIILFSENGVNMEQGFGASLDRLAFFLRSV